MKAPLMWLKDFVDIPVSTQELCDRMIMHGLGVEGVERVYEAYDKVVVGRLEAIVKHPDADKLQICTVRIAPEQTVTIVTGAPNVYEGMVCPWRPRARTCRAASTSRRASCAACARAACCAAARSWAYTKRN